MHHAGNTPVSSVSDSQTGNPSEPATGRMPVALQSFLFWSFGRRLGMVWRRMRQDGQRASPVQGRSRADRSSSSGRGKDQDLYCSQVVHRKMVGDSFLRKCPGTGSSRKIPPGRDRCRGENVRVFVGRDEDPESDVFQAVGEKIGSGSKKTGASKERTFGPGKGPKNRGEGP